MRVFLTIFLFYDSTKIRGLSSNSRRQKTPLGFFRFAERFCAHLRFFFLWGTDCSWCRVWHSLPSVRICVELLCRFQTRSTKAPMIWQQSSSSTCCKGKLQGGRCVCLIRTYRCCCLCTRSCSEAPPQTSEAVVALRSVCGGLTS